MSTAQNGKTASGMSAKQQLIVDAAFAFLAMKEQMGTSATYALDLFVEGLNQKTITVRQGRAILNDQNKFADFLVKAHEAYLEEMATAVRNAANADIADIKKATALKTTLAMTAIFCLISLPVSATEKALYDWAKSEITPPSKSKKPVNPPQPNPSGNTPSDTSDMTIQLKFGSRGLYDAATGQPPKLGGKEKVIVTVSVSPEGSSQPKRDRHPHHRPLKHCVR